MKLLVANRGEIAVRVVATAAALGLPTVAVHAEDDADGAHVARADEAVLLAGTGPAAYLDVDAVVGAGMRTGATLLHPGYGFLSENPALARACAAAGIGFVGPSPEDLELFGDKTAARARATALGIPVLDGTDAPTDLATARAFLDDLGPGAAVMVKARAGGGGRGMAPVDRVEDLPDALRRCASEARSTFGDDAVYVERLLRRARHVEVQVLGDGDAGVVLGDRDCSAQRRRQKLVEVAPAPDLDAGVRERLHATAVTLVGAYRGLATVEFLVAGHDLAFLEVNPRIQVEHTVTEEVTGLDLVELGLRVARGATLADLGLTEPPPPIGTAVQVRVNTETLGPDGSVTPSAGTLERFGPPSGRGLRVDTHGYAGYRIDPRYDSLLAKVIAHEPRGTVADAAARAARGLAEFDIAGVSTGLGLLRALLARPELATGGVDTGFVDVHLGELLAAAPDRQHVRTGPAAGEADAAAPGPPGSPPEDLPADATVVRSTGPGVVVDLGVAVGDVARPGTELVVLEAMKMEHAAPAPDAGVVHAVLVGPGDCVRAGDPLVVLLPIEVADAVTDVGAGADPDHVRPDLAEALERRRLTRDGARPDAVARRHGAGRRTAREDVADLLDPGSLVEYGALAIAAQRARRSVDDLVARTPADGLVAGTGTVDGLPVAVLAYDYTVLAGTQGVHNHRKTDRLLRLALRERLPLVVFAEGGGGRPGDTDTSAVAQLDVPTFRLIAELAGTVPTVAVVSGYCFAGNAALAGSCDVIIATEGSSLGMGGPAMIEGGGLGVVAPQDVGPADVQSANGVIDVLVPDDAAAVAAARAYLALTAHAPTAHAPTAHAPTAHAPTAPGTTHPIPDPADQRRLRHLVPENRSRSYDVRPVLDVLCDPGSLLELRSGFGVGIITALGRLGGRPVAVMANNPRHLGGAIDADAADKAARFLGLARERGLPVASLCDTPGFMVGPDAERTATVRRFGAMFLAGARLATPLCTVVLRKGYGLGAMAMAGGSLHSPALTVAWPTGEFGGMGLEGAVRLGYRKELEAIDDADRRRERYDELVAEYYERGKALGVATVFELDDVIDPADTRDLLLRALSRS